MPLIAAVGEAENSPFTMLWSLLVSVFASIVTRSVANGQEPTGRKSALSWLHLLALSRSLYLVSCAEEVFNIATGPDQACRMVV